MSHGCPASLVLLGIDSGKQAARTAKPFVPSFLVKMEVLGVDLFVKRRISYV
jgi:hypothetical protein